MKSGESGPSIARGYERARAKIQNKVPHGAPGLGMRLHAKENHVSFGRCLEAILSAGGSFQRGLDIRQQWVCGFCGRACQVVIPYPHESSEEDLVAHDQAW